MKKSILIYFQQLTIFSVVLISISVFSTESKPFSTIATLSKEQQQLSKQIDSLDLIKQDLKRNGKPIAELEQLQKSLRDSLSNIRHKIQTSSEAGPATNSKIKSHFFQKPTNLFDWIIIVVGAVAFLSGLMLIIGIFRTFTSKRIHKQRKRNTLEQHRSSPQTVAAKNDQPSVAYPDYNHPLPPHSPPTSITNTSLVKLQKRLEEQQQSTSYDTPELQEVLPSLDNLEDDKPENDDIEKKVLAAARTGADIPTISRKLHLSADHVSLILKVAATKNRSR